ncbi:unnamed protein product [Closterium sp. NIES-54]
MSLWQQSQQQQWSQWQRQQHRWPQLQQWRVQLQRLQKPPQRGPDGPSKYTHRYVGAATAIEPCVSILGACVVSGPGASEVLSVGAAATTRLVPTFVAGSGATSPTARLSFTLESGASRCFFHDYTDLTPLHTPVTVALVDPSVGSVVAESTTTLILTACCLLHSQCHWGASSHFPQGAGLWSPRVACPASSLACVEGRQHAAPHSSSFPPTTAPLQTLHLDVWGPSLVLGPRQERYFLIVVDNYSRYTTVFPLRRKVDEPTVLEPWLLARGGVQGLYGLRLHSDRGGEFFSTHLETFYQGRGILQSYTLPDSPQQNGAAERRIGLPSDAWPRVTPIFLWTGLVGVAADDRVWGCLAHVRAPGANKLSARTRACVFLGFPLDASSWVFYDPVTHLFFASQDVTFDKSSSPPQPPVSVVSGGAGGAVAEGEGTGAAGAHRPRSGGAGGVRVETTPEEDTAVLTQRPRPASPPRFPSVPQFPPRSPPRPVAAEPGGVPAGGTGVPGGVVCGGFGSGGAGAGDTSTATPTPRTVRFLTRMQHLDRLEREDREQFERARQQQQQSQSECQERVEEESLEEDSRQRQQHQQQQQSHSEHQERVEKEPRQQQPQSERQERVEEESRLPQVEEETQEQQGGEVPRQQSPKEAEQQRVRDLPDSAPARFVCGPLPSPPIPPVESLSSSQWTCRSPLIRAVSLEPRRSRYRADGPFHLFSSIPLLRVQRWGGGDLQPCAPCAPRCPAALRTLRALQPCAPRVPCCPAALCALLPYLPLVPCCPASLCAIRAPRALLPCSPVRPAALHPCAPCCPAAAATALAVAATALAATLRAQRALQPCCALQPCAPRASCSPARPAVLLPCAPCAHCSPARPTL